jgi:hypothetical protein
MPMTTLTIQEVNNIISEHFIKIFGNVVEHYPAAAIGILKNRPFQNSNDISVAINNFLDKLEMKGKFIKLFYKNCIDKYMFTESKEKHPRGTNNCILCYYRKNECLCAKAANPCT